MRKDRIARRRVNEVENRYTGGGSAAAVFIDLYSVFIRSLWYSMESRAMVRRISRAPTLRYECCCIGRVYTFTYNGK